MRDRLVRRVRRRLDDVEHGVDRHAVGRVVHELAPLHEVASHLDQSPQRVRLEGADQPGGAAPQRHRLRTARGLQLVRDLQQIADDHLVVRRGIGPGMVVDGAGDDRRLGGRGPVVPRLSREGGARQAHPQLRRPRPALGHGRAVVHQLEALVGEGVQLDVDPGAQPLRRAQPERLPAALRVHGQRLEDARHLAGLDAAPEGDGAEVVTVQPGGELGQHRVLRIGGDALDHQLLPRDAERECGAVFEQEPGAPGHARGRRRQRGMALRIHGVLVQRDRKLDQEVREVARQRRALTRGGRHEAKDTRTGNKLDAQARRRTGKNSKEGAEIPAPSSLFTPVASARLCV